MSILPPSVNRINFEYIMRSPLFVHKSKMSDFHQKLYSIELEYFLCGYSFIKILRFELSLLKTIKTQEVMTCFIECVYTFLSIFTAKK